MRAMETRVPMAPLKRSGTRCELCWVMTTFSPTSTKRSAVLSPMNPMPPMMRIMTGRVPPPASDDNWDSAAGGDLPDRLAEGVEGDGLAHDGVDAPRALALGAHEIAEAREHDDGDVRRGLLDGRRQLVAAHLRHRAVGHDQLETAGREPGEPLAAVRGGLDDVPLATELGDDGHAHHRIVVHQKDVERPRGLARLDRRADRGRLGVD